MQKKFDREGVPQRLAELAELEGITEDQKAALQFATILAELSTEGLNVETVGGEATILVELTDGYVLERPDGTKQHCDRVRLRQPRIADEWRRDALAVEINGGKEPPEHSILYDVCLVAQVIVDWPGVPMPGVREHLAQLSRYDASRLVQAVYALERHCDTVAAQGKSQRRSSS